jgi:site-specific recombinase XerD
MQKHLQQRRSEGATEKDFVFPSKRNKQASPAIIKSMIDLVTQTAPECIGLKIATHSLRISGAVLLMMAGFSATEIQIMGDWKSDIYLRYLRTLGLAVKRATTGMGL